MNQLNAFFERMYLLKKLEEMAMINSKEETSCLKSGSFQELQEVGGPPIPPATTFMSPLEARGDPQVSPGFQNRVNQFFSSSKCKVT